MYGRYYDNDGCAQYLNSIKKYSSYTNDNFEYTIVAKIFRAIYAQKQKNLTLSPKLENIYNYFESHSNPKFSPLYHHKDISDWKRLSKGLLQYSLDKPIKTHFILDGINLEQVLSKKKDNNGLDLITGSELRYIYRQWLKNPSQVDQKIVFWKDGGKVLSPWRQDPDAWSQYKSNLI